MNRRVLASAGGAAVVLVLAAVPASSSPGAPSANMTWYRMVFQGKGHAVSTYPQRATKSTVFTTDVRWRLVYRVRTALPCGLGGCLLFYPGPGSTLTGRQVGVVRPGGDPIAAGCNRIV